MSPSATPATRSKGGCRQAPPLPRKVPRRHRRLTAPKRATKSSPLTLAPRLPRKTKVDVTKCHACHVKRRWMPPSAMPATQSTAASPAVNRAQSSPVPQVPSATPATRSEGGCRQAPRLPRKVPRCHRRLTAPKRAQARHRIQPSAASATPATQKRR